MSRGILWKCSVRTTPEAEEIVEELLRQHFNRPVVSYTDVLTLRTTVSVYLEKKPSLARIRMQLKAGPLLPNSESPRVSLTKINQEDWANSWKRHFKPLEISSALLIRPSWSRRTPRKGQAVVELDPGLSFGTGHHPTTAFCLRQLASWRKAGSAQSFLDLGTGSGILAIAAAKLGYAPIDAIDFDPDSIRIARTNAKKNGVLRQIHFSQRDVRTLPLTQGKRYHAVCANLISDLLLAESGRILQRVRPDGIVIVAGILKREFPLLRAAYLQESLKLVASQPEKEWESGSFVWD